MNTHTQLERYLEELQRWGQRMNLVGSTARSAIQVHLDDALAVADQLPPNGKIVDLGTGAGLPGVPLAIARPDVRVTLVDSREKRAHFLRHVVRELGLSAEVRCIRFETEAPASFDVVCLRAVGPAETILPQAAPWGAEGGEIWLWTRLAAEAVSVSVRGCVELGERGRVLQIPVRGFPVEHRRSAR